MYFEAVDLYTIEQRSSTGVHGTP